MKKFIVVLVMVFLVTVAVNAQSVVLGAKGMFSMNLGTTYERYFKISSAYVNKVLLGGGGSIFGRYNLPLSLPNKQTLGIQLELIVSANNGKGFVEKAMKENGRRHVYTSVDVPLLVAYKIPFDMLGLTLSAGPIFSLPLGKIREQSFGNLSNNSYNSSVELYHFNMGVAASISVDYDVGSGNALFEVRYLNDFIPTITRTVSKTNGVHYTRILTRRALQFSVGYEVSF